MAGKGAEVDQFMRTPENLTGWQSFKRFIWNSETGEFCGRTGCSWLKITVFYIIFYSCLAAFWAAMLVVFYQTLDYEKPKWILSGSRIGTNPGLGFRPRPPEDNVDSTLIWVKHGSASTDWHYWVKNLDEFLAKYQVGGKHGDAMITTCGFDQLPTTSRDVCKFDLKDISSNCSTERHYGYDVGRPCVLIKLNRIYGWTPEPYTNDTLPEGLLKALDNEAYDQRYVYITCEGENPADRENIGPIHYYPSNKIPNYYFPFRNQGGYMSPFVFVHFEKPVSGVLVNIECKAWAKNIEHDRMERQGSVHFELLID